MIIPYTLIKDIPDIAGDSSQNIQTFAALYGKNKTLVLVLAIILTWLILFISIIPWFFALGVIIPIIFFVIKPKFITQKIWLLGLPVGIWFFGVLIHILII
jgi:4-hydroxybenzoate polyprenyltransferase